MKIWKNVVIFTFCPLNDLCFTETWLKFEPNSKTKQEQNSSNRQIVVIDSHRQCGQKWCFITKVVFWDTSVVWKFWQWCFHWKGWLFNFDLLISLKWGTFQTFSIFFVKKCIKCQLMWAFFEKNHPISNYQIIFKSW